MRTALRFFARMILVGLAVIVAIVATRFYLHDQDPNIAYVRDDTRQESVADVLCGQFDKRTRLFADMAAISALAYEKDGHSNDLLKSIRFERLTTDRIQKMLKLNKFDYRGLGISVWKSRDSDRKIIALAFRGTVDRRSWHANFHYFFKWLPFYSDQYEQVKSKLAAVIDGLIEDYGDGYNFYSTGHSLGGGLAQHALYVDNRINFAFAFNSSPVTGWSNLRNSERNVDGDIVYRVHEKGEILEFFRLLMKSSYVLKPDSNINPIFKEYRFNLTEGNLRSQHGISQIARRFYQIQNDECPALD